MLSFFGPHRKKTDLVACEQQRRRSACAFAQTDLHLCYSLPGRIIENLLHAKDNNSLVIFMQPSNLYTDLPRRKSRGQDFSRRSPFIT